jgi:hypothetical protein
VVKLRGGIITEQLHHYQHRRTPAGNVGELCEFSAFFAEERLIEWHLPALILLLAR